MPTYLPRQVVHVNVIINQRMTEERSEIKAQIGGSSMGHMRDSIEKRRARQNLDVNRRDSVGSPTNQP
jgi:hypothetical protein